MTQQSIFRGYWINFQNNFFIQYILVKNWVNNCSSSNFRSNLITKSKPKVYLNHHSSLNNCVRVKRKTVLELGHPYLSNRPITIKIKEGWKNGGPTYYLQSTIVTLFAMYFTLETYTRIRHKLLYHNKHGLFHTL